MLIRGFLYLIRRAVSGQPLEAVANTDLYFLRDSGLAENLNPDRRKGLGYVVKEILDRARQLMESK